MTRIRRSTWLILAALLLLSGPAAAQDKTGDWVPLFNGKDLDGWTPKIKGYEAGDNHADTFRVEDGVLKVGLRQVHGVRQQVRPPVLQGQVLALRPARRVPLRRRAGQGRARLGGPQQRRHVPLPVAAEHAQGPGLPRLHRGAVPRRHRQGRAPDAQRLHPRHQHRDGRQAHHPALHQLEVEDLPRRPVGDGRDRGPRRRQGDPPHQRRGGAGVREAAARPEGRGRQRS